MNDDVIKQMRLGFAATAAMIMYALNKDTMTIQDAIKAGKELAQEIDINEIMSVLTNEGV